MPPLIIEADNAERQYWRDLWAYRELFYFLAWRDLLVRYKQTVVGIAWSFIRPFLDHGGADSCLRKTGQDAVRRSGLSFAGILRNAPLAVLSRRRSLKAETV